MLYSALMIMEIIAGSAIEKISGPIFAVPILFCCSNVTLLRQTNRVRNFLSDAVYRFTSVYSVSLSGPECNSF